jgi:hypothetical protein
VHFARWNGKNQPLHVFTRSMNEWAGWQSWYPGRNDFNRPFVFSLMQMPGAPDHWLFGGIWEVAGLVDEPGGRKCYDVALTEQLGSVIGRMKLQRVHTDRGTRLNLEGHYEHFTLAEVLPERYTGRTFPGYQAVHLSFPELEELLANNRLDWITALRHVKGVYLITDRKSHRRYLGSAYGEWGVWSRWTTYAQLGHGGNVGMRDLLRDHDLGYCRENFAFTLLEHHDARTDDQVVLAREAYWKQVLDTRHTEHGMNRN